MKTFQIDWKVQNIERLFSMSLWFRIQAFARSFSLYIWVPMCLLRMLWQVSTWYAEVCCRVVFTTILGFLFLPQSGRNALLCMMQSTLMWFVDTGKNTATARVSVGATMKSCVLWHAKQESKQNVRCKFVTPSWHAHVGQFRMEAVTTLRAPNKPCLPSKYYEVPSHLERVIEIRVCRLTVVFCCVMPFKGTDVSGGCAMRRLIGRGPLMMFIRVGAPHSLYYDASLCRGVLQMQS